jgi:hypothetical protein
MPAAGQQFQANIRLRLGLRLRKDAPPNRHHGIGPQHKSARLYRCACLLARQPFGMRPRQFPALRRFIQVLRCDVVGNDPDLGKKGKPARACGGQDQPGFCVCQSGNAIT